MKTKATLPSLFILPITYDQFSTGFTSFISSDRISQFKLSDTEIFKQFPDIRELFKDFRVTQLELAYTVGRNKTGKTSGELVVCNW